jgi:periplasmic protein TonB
VKPSAFLTSGAALGALLATILPALAQTAPGQGQLINVPNTEQEVIGAYVRLLGKKVQPHLPHLGGRAATTVVSFTVLADGQIRPGSLKITKSTGQAALDAGALKAVRESAPFDPPPRELKLEIVLDFKKH